jgi:hypothetical protein
VATTTTAVGVRSTVLTVTSTATARRIRGRRNSLPVTDGGCAAELQNRIKPDHTHHDLTAKNGAPHHHAA